MPKIKYQSFKFRADTLFVIEQANAIVAEYAAQGFDLTLRQLYYQFVSRDLIANKVTEYKRLGSIINDARMGGLIDWDAIVDRTRNLRGVPTWDEPGSILRSAASSYRENLWRNQPNRVEVWIEKDALVGVIQGVCERNRVDYFSCRGYVSQSEMWAAGRRLRRYDSGGQRPIILHLGDHDPSGKDMTRDIADRLSMFAEMDARVMRLALNMDQVQLYNPPPNPAKETDSRFESYRVEFGDESWELDALEPNVIAEVIQKAIDSFKDFGLWDAELANETSQRELLKRAAKNWSSIESYLEDEFPVED